MANEEGTSSTRRGSDPENLKKLNGRTGGGDSGGGAYPNPHSGGGDKKDGGDFKGGQSDQAYYGEGQLGEEKLAGNSNAPSTQR